MNADEIRAFAALAALAPLRPDRPTIVTPAIFAAAKVLAGNGPVTVAHAFDAYLAAPQERVARSLTAADEARIERARAKRARRALKPR